MINATPVSNKFWILKDGKNKIGEVSNTQNGYTLSIKGNRTIFQTMDALKIKTGIVFADSFTPTKKLKKHTVHGYPVSGDNHNAVWDLKAKLPLYTKTQASKSWFAAGYYVVHIKGKPQSILSPKLIILQRNNYHGPYKTDPSYDSY